MPTTLSAAQLALPLPALSLIPANTVGAVTSTRPREPQATTHWSVTTFRQERHADTPCPTFTINAPESVYLAARAVGMPQWEHESFCLLLCNAQHKLLRHEIIEVTRGIQDSSLIHPREVFRIALLGNAASVILLHNHPSGDPTPSTEDRLVTSQLVAAGTLLGIPVRDHVIIGSDTYRSFAEMGLVHTGR